MWFHVRNWLLCLLAGSDTVVLNAEFIGGRLQVKDGSVVVDNRWS